MLLAGGQKLLQIEPSHSMMNHNELMNSVLASP
jgi:hypothetical protein